VCAYVYICEPIPRILHAGSYGGGGGIGESPFAPGGDVFSTMRPASPGGLSSGASWAAGSSAVDAASFGGGGAIGGKCYLFWLINWLIKPIRDRRRWTPRASAAAARLAVSDVHFFKLVQKRAASSFGGGGAIGGKCCSFLFCNSSGNSRWTRLASAAAARLAVSVVYLDSVLRFF